MQGFASVEPKFQGLNYHFKITSLAQIWTILIFVRFYGMCVKTMTASVGGRGFSVEGKLFIYLSPQSVN